LQEQRAKPGVAGLDLVLEGGLDPGHMDLVLGPSGVGKTTLGMQVLMPDLGHSSDNVVLFRYYEHDAEIRRAVAVLKRRSGAHKGSIHELSFGPDGLAVGPALKGFQGILTGVPSFDHVGPRAD